MEFYSYGLLTASTVMFAFMFFFNDLFRKHCGSDLKATMVMSLGGSIFGIVALLLINGNVFEFSLFALIMAIIATANGLAFSFCSLKALGKINLSLYSLFSMLGGMALPFVSGILFHQEPFTVGKALCFFVITVSLLLTVEKSRQKSSVLYYVGVFVFNGMSGVISKIYQALPYEKISSSGFSILKCLTLLLVAALFLLFLGGEKKKIRFPGIIAMAGSGLLNHLGNWLLLLGLVYLPASAQYPFVTGGTMIVSTVISLFSDKKPTKKEIAAVILSFIGILLLVTVPNITIFQFD